MLNPNTLAPVYSLFQAAHTPNRFCRYDNASTDKTDFCCQASMCPVPPYKWGRVALNFGFSLSKIPFILTIIFISGIIKNTITIIVKIFVIYVFGNEKLLETKIIENISVKKYLGCGLSKVAENSINTDKMRKTIILYLIVLKCVLNKICCSPPVKPPTWGRKVSKLHRLRDF